MTPEEIIEYCQVNNITLEPTDHGTIIVDVPDTSVWSDELTQAVKAHKAELISILDPHSAYNNHASMTCGNPKCLYQCIHLHNLDKCPWVLNEGTYRWKEGEWKRILH